VRECVFVVACVCVSGRWVSVFEYVCAYIHTHISVCACVCVEEVDLYLYLNLCVVYI